MGHWENISLDQNQCMYAATDAYVSINKWRIMSNNIFSDQQHLTFTVAVWVQRCCHTINVLENKEF